MRPGISGPLCRRTGWLLPAGAVIGSVLLFLLCYRFDNKYTTTTPQPRGGILLLDEPTLQHSPLLFLVNGWEAYPGLLTPEELHADPLRSGKSVFIGQYTGFDFGDTRQSRHGSATLLLNIALPASPRLYAMELPEIYSAYRLYINGELLCEMGDPAPEQYLALTGDRLVMFSASGNIELVLAMSDYSHIYSGLVYPPAFGEPQAVEHLLAARLAIRCAVFAVAFALGMFHLAVGLRLWHRGESGGKPTVLYGLLCLCFTGYTGYPLIKKLFPGGLWWYVLETFCYCAMLLLVALIQGTLCDKRGRLAWLVPVGGGVVCGCALLLPLIASGGDSLLRGWSNLLTLYFLLCALYLTVTAIYSIQRGSVRSRAMLCGVLVFDTALVMDRLLPDHEPIYTGWFSEWAGAFLVLCVGAIVAQDILNQYRLRRDLEENMTSMRRLMETQQAYYPLVLEQAEQARAARHDLRHHLAAIREFAASKNHERLASYLQQYDPAIEPTPVIFCRHTVLNMLLSHFAAQFARDQIAFAARADAADTLEFDDPDLFAIVANLLDNARDAVCRLPADRRWIHAGIRQVPGALAIVVDNPFDGVVHEQAGRLFSRKRTGRVGVGSASVRRITESYGGTAAWRWEHTADNHLFYAEILLPNRQGEPGCCK